MQKEKALQAGGPKEENPQAVIAQLVNPQLAIPQMAIPQLAIPQLAIPQAEGPKAVNPRAEDLKAESPIIKIAPTQMETRVQPAQSTHGHSRLSTQTLTCSTTSSPTWKTCKP